MLTRVRSWDEALPIVPPYVPAFPPERARLVEYELRLPPTYSDPEPWLVGLLGRVNAQPMASNDGPCETETLLLTGLHAQSDGRRAVFLYRATGWNRIWGLHGWTPFPIYRPDTEIELCLFSSVRRGFALLMS